MSFDLAKLDEHIERLRKGDTLTENEVKALCEKVRTTMRHKRRSLRCLI
jgi:serine/threonine-protein phosphatase 2A catalytic subunit